MLPIRPIPAAGTAPPRSAGRSGGEFRLAPDASGQPAPVLAAALTALPAGLLALQSEADPTARNRRAWRRGQALLDELQGLQADLLGAGADESRLQRIVGLCRGEAAADPGLRDAVEALVLRARLELARLGIRLSNA